MKTQDFLTFREGFRYEIRQAQSFEEFKAGLLFLSKAFNAEYGTYPRELPDRFFLAFDKMDRNKIVGTINLQVRRPDKKLEVEELFHLDLSELYDGSKYEIGEIGRLTSIDSYVT